MDIQLLKSRIDIISVAQQLGIQVGRNDKALCPFHNDQKPSLQFSREKQIATCFSSNCSLGTVDIIDLVKKKMDWTLPEVLSWLSIQAGMEQSNGKVEVVKTVELREVLGQVYKQFGRAYLASRRSHQYLEKRGLDYRRVRCGYNTGQLHRSQLPKEEAAKLERLGQYEKLGLIKPYGENSFSVFGKGCLVFALRDERGAVTGLYFRECNDVKANKHYYLKDRKGLYPHYPSSDTRRLVLCESVLDCETLRQNKDFEWYSVLANYGTEGSKEQLAAIENLGNLEEVILFFDGDDAGRKGAKKIAQYLVEKKPNLAVKIVETPKGEDINSLALGHEAGILMELVKTAKLFSFHQKTAKSNEKKKVVEVASAVEMLDTTNPNKLVYKGKAADYIINGGLRKEWDSLKVTLVVQQKEGTSKSRQKVDLYEDRQTEKVVRLSAEKLDLRVDEVSQDIEVLTDLLEAHRERLFSEKKEDEEVKAVINTSDKTAVMDFLKKSNLLNRINHLIGESGVVGEGRNRLFLFCIASSYKMPRPLHALVQGSTGSGKTHLLSSVLGLMPQEDCIVLTRVTESSFYNHEQYALTHKLIGIEDYDGLEEKAELAFRELQSKGSISSQTSIKDEQTGKITTTIKWVYGPIASLSATTKGNIYEDNMSRCFLVAVDESTDQTLKIIAYQNARSSGKIDRTECEAKQVFLQNCIRVLESYDVVNPYADKIHLPKEAHKLRRLNELFQSFIRQVTLLNQYQRKRDSKGRLITEKEDVATAIEIMFESIVLKVDELDGSLRGFYEKLKEYVGGKGKDYEFTQREIRHQMRLSKTGCQNYFNNLLDLEYLHKSNVSHRNTYHYKISYWDNLRKIQDKVRNGLTEQLEQL